MKECLFSNDLDYMQSTPHITRLVGQCPDTPGPPMRGGTRRLWVAIQHRSSIALSWWRQDPWGEGEFWSCQYKVSTYSPQNYICRAWDVVLIVPEAAIQRLPGYSFQEQGGLRKGTLGIISSLVVSKLNLKVLLTQADPNASRVGLPCHRCPEVERSQKLQPTNSSCVDASQCEP